ncbi:rCG61917 [Rattus norvegicus]|uniref:RCG61917 n=1 Tax=Rattus norvegicus TaxID=10116 RepID=A6HBQ6_RAT|nr:rCG61917 [Rattus norvegicus]
MPKAVKAEPYPCSDLPHRLPHPNLLCVQACFTPDQDQQDGTLGRANVSCQYHSFDVYPGRLYCGVTESHNHSHVKPHTPS